MITIIGLSGPKQSGKDTSADLLADISDGSFAFAKNLKSISMRVFNLSYDEVYNELLKEKKFDNGSIIITEEHLQKIYDILPEYLNIDYEPFENLKNKFNEKLDIFLGLSLKNPRAVLQFVGTDYIRNFVNQNWHLLSLFPENFNNTTSISKIYIITDVRFPNEYQYLENYCKDHNYKFYGFYIHRDLAEEKLKNSDHDSERQVIVVRSLVEHIIYNNGTLEELKNNLLKILERVF